MGGKRRKKHKPTPLDRPNNDTATLPAQETESLSSSPVPAEMGPTPPEAGAAAQQVPGAAEDAALAAGETEAPEPVAPAALLREAEAQRDEYLELAQMTQAELENYRKRVQRDMAQLKRESLAGFLQQFLGAFDDLDRTIAAGEKGPKTEELHAGIMLVRENLWQVMAKAGVRKIPAKGEKFDPAVHEAMTTVSSSEHEPNTILEEFQPGYLLDGFVLRPAKVIVSSLPEKRSQCKE